MVSYFNAVLFYGKPFQLKEGQPRLLLVVPAFPFLWYWCLPHICTGDTEPNKRVTLNSFLVHFCYVTNIRRNDLLVHYCVLQQFTKIHGKMVWNNKKSPV